MYDSRVLRATIVVLRADGLALRAVWSVYAALTFGALRRFRPLLLALVALALAWLAVLQQPA